MNKNNELNDIILNKGTTSNSNKKIILAVATLGIILIIVVMLMNSLTSNGTDNLPQAVLPPKPQMQLANDTNDKEPLFEDIEVVQDTSSNDNLTEIAKKLKKESLLQEKAKEVVKIKEQPKPIVKRAPSQESTKSKKPLATSNTTYYIQVGSFSTYEPNKKFLNSITDLGFTYEYHKVTIKSKVINKVLVGPFKTQKEAKDARRILRSKVEPGAFLFKL